MGDSVRLLRVSTPAQGFDFRRRRNATARDTRQYTVTLPADMYTVIAADAAKNGWSFAEQLRCVLEWGLESAGEG